MDLHAETSLSNDLKSANVGAIASISGEASMVRLELCMEGKVIAKAISKVGFFVQLTESKLTDQVNSGIASVNFQIDNPELWWPFTYGTQPLYTLCASISHNGLILDNS